MFCPSCSANNSVEQKFCRSCGMNLEGTVASLLEQFPDGARSELQKQEQKLERFGNIAFTGFAVVLGLGVLGLLYWILDKMVIGEASPLPGILLMAFIVFAALTLSYVVMNEHLKEKRAKLGKLPDQLPAAKTGKLLDESRFEPVPTSVTEGTTQLLNVRKGEPPA